MRRLRDTLSAAEQRAAAATAKADVLQRAVAQVSIAFRVQFGVSCLCALLFCLACQCLIVVGAHDCARGRAGCGVTSATSVAVSEPPLLLLVRTGDFNMTACSRRAGGGAQRHAGDAGERADWETPSCKLPNVAASFLLSCNLMAIVVALQAEERNATLEMQASARPAAATDAAADGSAAPESRCAASLPGVHPLWTAPGRASMRLIATCISRPDQDRVHPSRDSRINYKSTANAVYTGTRRWV